VPNDEPDVVDGAVVLGAVPVEPVVVADVVTSLGRPTQIK
jgi:hypothetical protein